jgi:hypothetical protein
MFNLQVLEMIIDLNRTKESEIQMELTFDTISQLDEFFVKIGEQGPLHGKWGKETSQFVVSGSNYWEVLRIVKVNFEKDN